MNKLKEIQELREKILVHSYIYYELNTNIISDAEFDSDCKRLVELQKQQALEDTLKYGNAFKQFEGITGYYFQYDDKPEIIAKAKELVEAQR